MPSHAPATQADLESLRKDIIILLQDIAIWGILGITAILVIFSVIVLA